MSDFLKIKDFGKGVFDLEADKIIHINESSERIAKRILNKNADKIQEGKNFVFEKIKKLVENNEIEFKNGKGITGLYLPTVYGGSFLINLIRSDPANNFVLERNTIKYRHRKNLLIEKIPANVPAVDYLNGFPELIVEPTRTNLILNSEPTTDEQAANGITYLNNVVNSLGITNWVNLPLLTGNFRYAGITTSGKTYEYQYLFITPKEFDLRLSIDRFRSTLAFRHMNDLDTNKKAKIKVHKIGNQFFKIIVKTNFSSSNGLVNGIVIETDSLTGEDLKFSGLSLVESPFTNFTGSYIRTTGTNKTVDADIYTINNLVTNGLISATEGTIIERGSNQEVRTVWIGGNKIKYIDNAQVSTLAELPNDNTFTLDTSSYRLSEVLIYNKAIIP